MICKLFVKSILDEGWTAYEFQSKRERQEAIDRGMFVSTQRYTTEGEGLNVVKTIIWRPRIWNMRQ